MEYHVSPPYVPEIVDQLGHLRNQQRECLLCALVADKKFPVECLEKKVSDIETHYWVDDWTEYDTEHPHKEHIEYYASMYQQSTAHRETPLPPAEAVLVETIRFSYKQLSATWRFVKKEKAPPPVGDGASN